MDWSSFALGAIVGAMFGMFFTIAMVWLALSTEIPDDEQD